MMSIESKDSLPHGTLRDLVHAELEQLSQWEARVGQLVRQKGGSLSASEFQGAVNVLFHDVEAAEYDTLHQEMWDSLQPVFSRLVGDLIKVRPSEGSWTVADVGCGTGLAIDLLLRTSLRHRVGKLQMVDTSEQMIARCRTRAASWDIPTEFTHGQIDSLPDASADIVVSCSVLHHIPTLFAFCAEVERVLKPGGFFLHVHDPRRGAQLSEVVLERANRLRQMRRRSNASVFVLPLRIYRTAVRKLRDWLQLGYLHEVNRRLIAAGLINTRLTAPELWSITDLRVGDLPYSAGDGVAIAELAVALPQSRSVSVCTYGFFGVLASNLPPGLVAEEQLLFDASSNEGVFLAGLWHRQQAD